MQLPDFIKQALAFFSKAESHFTAEEKLKAAESALALSGQKVTELTSAKDALETQLAEVKGSLQAAQTELTQKAGEITILQGQVADEKKRANEVLARQGLSLEELPAAESKETPGGSGETAWAKYYRLLGSNPTEAGEFYAKNADKILGSRPK
jgi:septal ring factor EnvC (AmiA/AmiB activator)